MQFHSTKKRKRKRKKETLETVNENKEGKELRDGIFAVVTISDALQLTGII